MIVGSACPSGVVGNADRRTSIDQNLVPLLDHIAGELAGEYVRMMEAAAHADTQSATRGKSTERPVGTLGA